jgi:hypothetical protein
MDKDKVIWPPIKLPRSQWVIPHPDFEGRVRRALKNKQECDARWKQLPVEQFWPATPATVCRILKSLIACWDDVAANRMGIKELVQRLESLMALSECERRDLETIVRIAFPDLAEHVPDRLPGAILAISFREWEKQKMRDVRAKLPPTM